MVFATGFFASQFAHVAAAPVTITVNSTNDGSDVIAGNGTCETSTPGECTLRAAIEEANANGNPADQDVIEFNIPGGGVHTINLGSIIYISQNVLINGYTQPGASANTVAWPGAMDGTLLIEITGDNAALNPNSNADGTIIRGLIINNTNIYPITVDVDCDNTKIEGNYINTDPSGLIADWGTSGSHGIISSGSGTTVGGTSPEQRNVVTARGIFFGTVGGDNTVVQGNNFGVGSDSVTPLPQDATYSSSVGAVLIDGVDNIVGGSSTGEGNYISNAALNSGLLLSGASNTVVLGNQIVDNNNHGISITTNSSGITIGGATSGARNTISGNVGNPYGDGINIDSSADDVTIQGNYIGVDSDGVTPLPNSHVGITSFGSNVTIGGSASGEGNVISGNVVNSNEGGAIVDRGANGVIQGNYIGVGADGTTAVPNDGYGIYHADTENSIIGGSSVGEANIIANNGAQGVLVNSGSASIIGNSIYDNTELGIDIGLVGVTPNDLLDSDVGANDLLNYPEMLPPIESGGDTFVSYQLDVPAADYRVEIFENTAYDPSGNGEGETLIGTANITSNGSGVQLFNTQITGTGFTNISATVTKIDVSSPTGFGPTSEFSGQPIEPDIDSAVTKSIVDSDTVESDGNIQYNVSFTNNGTTNIDLTQYDNGTVSSALNTALFNDIFPSELTFTSVDGNASCVDENSASGFGTLFSDHADMTVLSCSYNGGDAYLAPGDTLNFVLHFDISDPLSYSSFTNYLLSVPSVSDGSYGEYNYAVGTGNDLLGSLGTTIDNLVVSTFTPLETDLSLTKVLTNPEDTAPGNTLSYDFTVTNNGPGFSNMNRFNNVFAGSSLLTDFVPPDLTPVNLGADMGGGFYPLNDVGNLDVSCAWAPHGSAGLYYGFTTYASYGLVICQYIGADTVFLPNTSIPLTIDFSVDAGSELSFKNYASISSSFLNLDPDSSALDDIITGYEDFLNGLIQTAGSINNFSYANLPSDFGVTSTIENPEALQYDSTVYYDVNLENRGPAGVDLRTFNRFDSSLFLSIYSPNDLTYVESLTTGVECTDIGPATNIGLSTAIQDHGDYHALVCVYSGGEQILGVDETYTVRLGMKGANRESSNVNLYTFNGSAPFDPDFDSLLGGLFGASEDILDTFTNDNYARVSSISTASPVVLGNVDDTSSGALSSTGQNVRSYLIIAAALLVIGSGSAVYYLKRRQKTASLKN